MEVDAPDGSAALELERRLWRLHPTTIYRNRHWLVEVDTRVEEVENVVEGWLRDIGWPETVLRYDDRELRVQKL